MSARERASRRNPAPDVVCEIRTTDQGYAIDAGELIAYCADVPELISILPRILSGELVSAAQIRGGSFEAPEELFSPRISGLVRASLARMRERGEI